MTADSHTPSQLPAADAAADAQKPPRRNTKRSRRPGAPTPVRKQLSVLPPAVPDGADPDVLSAAEEEAYAMLVQFARDKIAASDKANDRRQQQTRVEFSRLVTRARACRFLLSYFSGAMPSKAMAETGISWGDIAICRLASPDFDAAFKFCKSVANDRLALKALEIAEKAVDGAEIGRESASLSKFILERLSAGDGFGDPRYKIPGVMGGGGGGGLVYNINIIQAAGAGAGVGTGVGASQSQDLCGIRVAQSPAVGNLDKQAAIDV